jgi:3-(methylthio)propanoyl-CoA dehydrogenase
MRRKRLAPLNRLGDTHGVEFAAGTVRHPPGFREAYRAYVDGGWRGIAADLQFGGQGPPFAVAAAISEQIISANMALLLCLSLTTGAIEAISAHGSVEIGRLE